MTVGVRESVRERFPFVRDIPVIPETSEARSLRSTFLHAVHVRGVGKPATTG